MFDAVIDPKRNPSRNPKVATQTTNKKITKKRLNSWFVPKIIPVVIRLVNLLVTADVVGVQEILSLRQTVLPKTSVTDAACSCAHISGLLGRLYAQAGTAPFHGTSTQKKRTPGSITQAQAPTLTPSPQRAAGHKRLSVQVTPVSLKGTGTPIRSTLPFMDLWP